MPYKREFLVQYRMAHHYQPPLPAAAAPCFRMLAVPMAGAILLFLHIAAGSVALLGALVALVAAKGRRYHILAGRVYAIAMTVIFLTSLPLAILGASAFLLLIAVFSFHLVFAGWRFARNRRGAPQSVDWCAAAIMGLTGLTMWGYGIALGRAGNGQWVTMLIFGAIAVALSLVDARYYVRSAKRQTRASVQRVQRHLTNMLAGTIATVTAVAVVNVDPDPVWLTWILPTLVITPLIIWWNVRVDRRRQ